MTATKHEGGSASVELAILTPVLVLLLLFVIAVGRLVDTRSKVDAAAADAARAASWASGPTAATAAASQAASSDLTGDNLSCHPFNISVDTTRFAAGGAVVVHLSCVASMAGLSALRLPGSETLSSSSAAPIDTYRTVQGG